MDSRTGFPDALDFSFIFYHPLAENMVGDVGEFSAAKRSIQSSGLGNG